MSLAALAIPPLPLSRVCIDARMLGAAGGTGVATYASTLVQTLQQIGSPPLLLTGDGGRGRFARLAAAALPGRRRAHALPAGFWRRDIFREAHVHFSLHGKLLPIRLSGPPGVMHWTYPLPLRVEGWRNLYTVHDVVPLTAPKLTPIDPDRHRRVLGRIVEAADRIVTVSEYSAGAIRAALGCDPDLVVNLGQGIAPQAANDEALPEGLEPGGYFFFCGALEPRKNLLKLARAYRASYARRPLVIAGPDGWQAERIRPLLAATPGVVLLPYQSRSQLAALMRQSRAFLFPTLAEGFGLPIVEAMALGAPVMTSRLGANAEAAGGAALLVDPLDAGSLAAAIGRLDLEDDLCQRLALGGLERASHFTLDRYGARLADFYRTVAA